MLKNIYAFSVFTLHTCYIFDNVHIQIHTQITHSGRTITSKKVLQQIHMSVIPDICRYIWFIAFTVSVRWRFGKCLIWHRNFTILVLLTCSIIGLGYYGLCAQRYKNEPRSLGPLDGGKYDNSQVRTK